MIIVQNLKESWRRSYKTIRSSNGHQYILLAVDYFSKWVETASYSKLGLKQVDKLVINNIICWDRVPFEMVYDNGSQFEGDLKKILQNIRSIITCHLYIAIKPTGLLKLPTELYIISCLRWLRKHENVKRRSLMPFEDTDLPFACQLVPHYRHWFTTWILCYQLR